MRGFYVRRVKLRLKQKAAVNAFYGGAAKGMKKPPAKSGGRGVKLESKCGARGGKKFAKCKPVRA